MDLPHHSPKPSVKIPLPVENADTLPPVLAEQRQALGQVERIERVEKIRRFLSRTTLIFNELKKQQASRSQLHEIQELEKKVAMAPTVKDFISLAHRYSALGFNQDADRMLELAEKCQAQNSSGTGPASDSLLSGAIAPLMLIEVLQLLSRTNKSGELVLESPDGSFHIFLDRGQIVNASSDRYEPGLSAFYMGVRVTQGSYRFILQPDLHVEHLIEDRTENLIMEAARLMDESSSPEDESNAP